jgi:uncharacterized membrane protein YbhN (UPF0104 family)
VLRRYLLPLLGTILIVWLLLRQIQPRLIGQMLRGADGHWLLAGLGFYLLTNVLRCYRFGVLWPAPGMFSSLRLLPEMVALSFCNNVLPARGGELSFPFLMQRRHDLPVGESAAFLLVLRLFDFLTVVSLYLPFAALEEAHLPPGNRAVIGGVALLLAPSLLLLALLPWLGGRGLQLGCWLLRRLRLANTRVGRAVLAHGEKAVAVVERVHHPGVYGRLFFWSILGWLATFAWFAAFMTAVGLPLRYSLVVVGATFATLSKAIPFITIGSIGAHDAGWALGFHLIGLETEAAIASGFAENIFTLSVSFLVGIVAFAYLKWTKVKKHGNDKGEE